MIHPEFFRGYGVEWTQFSQTGATIKRYQEILNPLTHLQAAIIKFNLPYVIDEGRDFELKMTSIDLDFFFKVLLHRSRYYHIKLDEEKASDYRVLLWDLNSRVEQVSGRRSNSFLSLIKDYKKAEQIAR